METSCQTGTGSSVGLDSGSLNWVSLIMIKLFLVRMPSKDDNCTEHFWRELNSHKSHSQIILILTLLASVRCIATDQLVMKSCQKWDVIADDAFPRIQRQEFPVSSYPQNKIRKHNVGVIHLYFKTDSLDQDFLSQIPCGLFFHTRMWLWSIFETVRWSCLHLVNKLQSK